MPSFRPTRTRVTVTAVAVAAFAAGAVLSQTGVAGALPGAPTVLPPAVPTTSGQIQNIDRVRIAIKAYYGDTVTTTMDPVNGTTALHEPDPDGNWAKEATGVADRARAYIRSHPGTPTTEMKGRAKGDEPRKTLLLDVDDTSLVTYDYEIYSNFAYNPTSNAAFVNAATFPAVAGMVKLTQAAEKHGYDVIWLTGRPESQRSGTVTNLEQAGFGSPDTDHLYLKDLTKPIYSSCAPSCTTIEYKSLTRKYIESQGYDIVVNMGDQQSDLKGGYADQTYRMPNPMYYLP